MKSGRLRLAAAALALMAANATAGDKSGPSAFDFQFTSIDGKPMPLADYKGRVLLVVNVASFCGFTSQYKALQAVHAKYEPQGFAVIGVPSNDFAQETKDESEIKKFCEGMFGVTFPLTDKNVITGDAAHPFYKWAREQVGWLNAPKWNFHKYLIGRDGRVITTFFTTTSPDSSDVTAAIETALAKKVAATGE